MQLRHIAIMTLTSMLAGPCSSALAQCEHPFLEAAQTLARSPVGADLVTGDFNDDGSVDVAGVISHPFESVAGIEVWLNGGGGDGVLGTSFTRTGFANARSIVAADFDADGDTDLAVASDGRVVVFRYVSGQTFTTQVTEVAGSLSWIAAGDLNGDNVPDVLAYNPIQSRLVAVINNGDGSFGAPATIDSIAVSRGRPAIADFNDDGNLDVALAAGETTLRVFTGRGDGTFDPPTVVDVSGLWPSHVRAADVDGDGDQDIVQAKNTPSAGGAGDAVVILLNDGSATFTVAAEYEVASMSGEIHVADLDADGDTDVACTTMSDDFTLGVGLLLNAGDGSFGAAVYYGFDYRAPSLALGDLDADGSVDAAIATGVFPDPTELHTRLNICEAGSTPGDVNGDGVVDFADLVVLLGAWGSCEEPCPPSCPADLDQDCVVGVTDLLLVLSNWG